MGVEEVKNETFKSVKAERKRKRVKVKKTEEEPVAQAEAYVNQKSMQLSEYVLNSTNTNHRVYREILIDRKNGERISSLNPFK